MDNMNDTHHLRARWNISKRRQSITESIDGMRSTILINMAVEALCTVFLIVGFVYLIRFLFFWRGRMIDLHFKLFVGAIVLFAAVWTVFTARKLCRYYRRLQEISQHRN